MNAETPPARPLPLQVAQWIDRHELLKSGQSVLLGVSGGPDSIAMLHVLVELSAQSERRYRLHVAHLDHRLRAESAEEARFVRDQAEALHLPCVVAQAEPLRPARGSLETQARQARYAFLESTARELDCPVIATAHHGDDQVETVLHRIVRGTALEGLRGIAPKRRLEPYGLWLVRPMLDADRERILLYLRARDLQWIEDSSNADTRFTRNRIRHELLPLLRERFNPKVDQAILRLQRTAEWAGQWMDEQARETLTALTVDRSDRHVSLSAPGLRRRARWPAAMALRMAMEQLGARLQRVGLEHVERILRLLGHPAPGGRIQLPEGLEVRLEADKLVLELAAARPAPPQTAPELELSVPGRTILPDGATLEVSLQSLADPVRAGEAMPVSSAAGPARTAQTLRVLKEFLQRKTPCQEMLDADRLALPLIARRRRAGDRFLPLGGEGHKKLSDLFGDLKIPPRQREQAWIICDQLGPVWVAPYRIDHRVRVTAQTRRLALLHLRTPPPE